MMSNNNHDHTIMKKSVWFLNFIAEIESKLRSPLPCCIYHPIHQINPFMVQN